MEEQVLQNNKGYIALILSIIVLFIGIAVTTSLIFLHTSYNKNVLILEDSLMVKNLVDICFREALFEIYQNYEVAGEYEKEVSNGNCFYNILTDGDNKIIEIKGNVNNSYKEKIVKINSNKEILSID